MASCILNLMVAPGLRYTLVAANAIQGSLATVGNFIVFIIIIKNRRLRTRSNVLLMSLAATDLLVGLVVEPVHVAQFLSEHYRKDCRVNSVRRILTSLFLAASINSLAVISYDRYLHLTKTVNYSQHMSKMKVTLLLITCWLMAVLLQVIRSINQTMNTVVAIVHIHSIIIIMLVCYIVIMRTVKEQRVSITQSNMARQQIQDTRRNVKAAKAVTTIITILMLTYLPIALFFAALITTGLSSKLQPISSNAREIGYAITITVAMTNSAFNPLIYFLRIPEYKASFKKLFGIKSTNSVSLVERPSKLHIQTAGDSS